MSVVDTILTNTILIPTSGSLDKLQNTTIGGDLQTFANNFDPKKTVLSNQFKLFLNSGGDIVPLSYCQSINRLEIERAVEKKKSGGVADYEVKLPGPIQYRTVAMTNLITGSEVFFDWLINNADLGGIRKADMEIRVGDENDYMLYTLRDVFPVSWNFGTMTLNVQGMLTNEETLTYSMKNGEILIESLNIVYSAMEYSRVTAPASDKS